MSLFLVSIFVNDVQMLVGALSSIFLLYAPPIIGIRGVWYGLALFMGLRTAAGFIRYIEQHIS